MTHNSVGLQRLVSLRLHGRRRGLAPPDEVEAGRVERVLAIARAYLAVLAAIAIYIDASEPTYSARLTYALLVLFVVWSLALVALTRSLGRASPALTLGLHISDLVWPAVITSFTAGPNSPLFPFFLFALLAAAYRWGLAETLITGAVAASVLMLQVLAWVSLGWAATGSLAINSLMMRMTYLFITAFLVGFLADAEKRRRSEADLITGLMRQVRVDRGVRGSVRELVVNVVAMFGASEALLVIRDVERRATAAWRLSPSKAADPALTEADHDVVTALLSPELPSSLYARHSGAGAPRLLSPTSRDGTIPPTCSEAVSSLFRTCGGRTLLSAAFMAGSAVEGRLVLVDPDCRVPPQDLRFLEAVIAHVAPGLHNLYLVGRLRSDVGALERTRLARELHDGAIQSLLGLEIRMDVLRRKIPDGDPLAPELLDMQRQLHEEAVSLRELMQRMRAPTAGARNLLEYLAHSIDKFRRDTGIAASFTAVPPNLTLPRRLAGELARIAQEALSNVRRHSGARSVIVRLRAEGGLLTLLVDDDGHGFGFTGRLEGAGLDRAARAPLMIRERARALGADLAVESSPEGSRIELRLRLDHVMAAWLEDEHAPLEVS